MSHRRRQPFLHDLVTVFAAPTQVLADATGEIGTRSNFPTAEGVIHADVRVLSRVSVQVEGSACEHIATDLRGSTADFTYLLRDLGNDQEASIDPQVRLDRRREVAPGTVTETLRLTSHLPAEVATTVQLTFRTDLAAMETIHFGLSSSPHSFGDIAGDRVSWGVGPLRAELVAPGATLSLIDDDEILTCQWPVTVPARGSASVGWAVQISDPGGAVVAAPPLERATAELSGPLRQAALGQRADPRLQRWLEQAQADLDALRMALPGAPAEVFYAAGVPWYLTLFGRDSLWTARMMLPLDLRPAAGTLRVLARLQGRRIDPDAAEQPGKIMHELRRQAFAFGDIALPPLYFGTIDATPLWVCLLHDAWRAGLAEDEVVALLPALEAALGWLITDADADGDGFVEYLDETGHGLANQGWKDSADAVRFADGTRAEGAVALCEVQGYAYEAAMSGAALADAFGRPDGDRYRAWAAALAERFRGEFWCGQGPDRYPALALDGRKQRVDALTSNIGHLLGTGILTSEEEGVVARHVSGPRLDSGLGLRTMSDGDGGYSPLSYHCGSVWPHDTAIVIEGLRRAGRVESATGLIDGLLHAAAAFDYRLPELWSGEGRPVPYPAACRPQAWSAAAAVVVAQALAGSG